jgi:hypothetical protein
MDQGTAYILGKLDLIIDRQRDQTDMLTKVLAAKAAGEMTTQKKRFTLKRKWSPFSQTIAGGALIWSFGLATKSYLDHGGTPLELIEALLKVALGFFFGAA